MKNLFLVSFAVYFTLILPIAQAEYLKYYHYCYKPDKPLFMAPSNQISRYKKDVSKYNFCVEEFIKEQESEIQLHIKAIEKVKKERELVNSQ